MIQPRITSYRRSQGAILIVALVLLLAMTIVGVASIDTTMLQSQMSRNSLEANTRYQVSVNEIEAQIKQAADSLDYRQDMITKGAAISSSSNVGVSNDGTGYVLTDSDMVSQDTSDPYTQSGYAVFPGYDTGAHHGFTIGDTRMMVIEFNIITTLTSTEANTNLTQAALYTAPGDNE